MTARDSLKQWTGFKDMHTENAGTISILWTEAGDHNDHDQGRTCKNHHWGSHSQRPKQSGR